MPQIYYLSVTSLLISGIALSFERLASSVNLGAIFNAELFARPVFRLVTGAVTMLVGFFQFLSVAPGDVPIIGDLVPALTGLLLGGILLVGFYREKSTTESPFLDRVDRLVIGNAANFGILGIVVALLHFLFFRALFL